MSIFQHNIREEVVTQKLRNAGWQVVLSNDVVDAKQALVIYRQKDVVDKGFWRLKTQLDLGRLRVHRDDSMQNKLFIGFIALILMSYLHTVMSDKALYGGNSFVLVLHGEICHQTMATGKVFIIVMERELIKERVKAGLDLAKQQGRSGGRPKALIHRSSYFFSIITIL